MKRKLAVFLSMLLIASPLVVANAEKKEEKIGDVVKITDYVSDFTKQKEKHVKADKKKDDKKEDKKSKKDRRHKVSDQSFMWTALEKMEIREDKSKLKVKEELTKGGSFVVSDDELGLYFFSLKTDSAKKKIHYVILDDETIIPADPELSYDNRPAFSSKDGFDDSKVDYVIYHEKGKDYLTIADVNVSLKRYKVKETKKWEYDRDGFPLSKVLHSDAYDEDKGAKAEENNSGARRAK